MNNGQFTYMTGRALSHASLEKFRKKQLETRADLNHKNEFLSRPNVKYYVSSNQNPNTIATRAEGKKIEHPSKVQQQLKKRIKVLEYELKNKISQNSYLVKIFKAKNSSEMSHLDIYLQMRKMEQQLVDKTKMNEELEIRMQECSKQIQQLLSLKNEQQEKHTNEIKSFTAMVEKLSKKHQVQVKQKQSQLLEQRKSKEQKDLLLKQIRKKYESSQTSLSQLQDEIQASQQQIMKIQKSSKQRMLKMKQEHEMKIQKLTNELQKLTLGLRQQEQLLKQTHQKYTVRQLQMTKNNKRLEAQINSRAEELRRKQQQDRNIRQEIQYHVDRQNDLQSQIQDLKNNVKQLRNQLNKSNQAYQNLEKQLENQRLLKTDQIHKQEKYSKQLSKQQSRIMQLNSLLKVLQYQNQEKQGIINKNKQLVTQKQVELQKKDSEIEELECKLFNAERRANSSSQRVKQMQKQALDKKQYHQFRSKLQIQSYKSIGRLTQLIQQLRSLSDYEPESECSYSRFHITKAKPRQVESPQSQSISQCVDSLTKYINNLIKIHNNSQEQNRFQKEFIQQVLCDLKSIFHAYNSFLLDDQLKQNTREYLQCLQEHGLEINNKSKKIQRSGHLQTIMERLISMIAIQSYTSQNGMKRQQSSKSRTKTKYHSKNTDSLQNTTSNWDQPQQVRGYQQQKQFSRQTRNKQYDYNSQKQRQAKLNRSRRRSTYKLLTEPNQIQNYAIRRLEYGKENLMQRINRPEVGNKKYSYQRQDKGEKDKYSSKYLLQLEDNRYNAVIKRGTQNQSEQHQQKQSKKDKKITLSDAELIEKKYFR